jgi:hypothetical protein
LAERQIIKLVIAALIDSDFMSVTLQQPGFLGDYNILSTWVLVSVMDD